MQSLTFEGDLVDINGITEQIQGMLDQCGSQPDLPDFNEAPSLNDTIKNHLAIISFGEVNGFTESLDKVNSSGSLCVEHNQELKLFGASILVKKSQAPYEGYQEQWLGGEGSIQDSTLAIFGWVRAYKASWRA